MGDVAKKHTSLDNYHRFDTIDGRHPLREVGEPCFVDYPVRERDQGKVAVFNYKLAREIGLIDENHPDEMNKSLEEKILTTFGLIIINEYDKINKIQFPAKEIKKNSYMATRYLQLQHPNKQGRTSGDGRSIWNGYICHRGKIYDISSCGTGSTRLSPATSINKKFFKSGDATISYGCGYSEVDEGLETLFFSEILHRNSIATERVLAVIDYGKNIGITVRVSENLLRPSHFFNHLKQGDRDTLEKMVDYYIDRQAENGVWENVPQKPKEKMAYFLAQESKTFAQTAANFEDEYIFCWMDWDGDNIMANGGIIDYGSIRQFGLYHSEYRYDDVERYSTTLAQQKDKARYIVQSFAQMVDFIVKGKKRPLKDFANCLATRDFDRYFKHYKRPNLARKIGLSREQVDYLVAKHPQTLDQFRKVFHYFEGAKSVKGTEEVADGINHNAIFCMRDILRELPQLYLAEMKNISGEDFIEIIKSNYALPSDLTITPYRQKKIDEYQKCYWSIIEKVAKYEKIPLKKLLLSITMRSSIINKYDRITGDSISFVVAKILGQRPQISGDEIYNILEQFVEYQNRNPESKKPAPKKEQKNYPLMKNIFKIVRDCREGL